MAPSSPPSSRRQLLIRLGGVFFFLAIAGAIIAGVLVSKAKEEEARDTRNPTRPNTYNVMNDQSLPPVQAKAIPSVDSDYPYQNRPKDTVVNTTVKAAQGTFGGGGINIPGAAVSTGPVGGAVDKALSVDNLGPNSTFFGRIYARGWNEVAQSQGVGVCYPANAAEVVDMVMSPGCTIIVLTRSYRNPYKITQTMNITSRKIVVGNPLQPPRFLGGPGLHRYFDVQDGGNLDLRAFVMTRPDRYRVGPDGLFRMSVASCILVRPGGNLHTVGVTFKLGDQELGQTFRETFPNLMEGAIGFTFGGYVMQIGGTWRADGTWFSTFRPLGNTYLRSFSIGGNILMLAGDLHMSGSWMIGSNAYRSEIVVGSTIATFFGNVIFNGGGIISANLLSAQYGAAMMLSVVGGHIIDNGKGYVSTNGCIHRAGYTQWGVFGGTHIRTGYQQCRVWGVGTTNIYGQTYAVTAGVLHYIGGIISSTANSFMFAGVGNTVGMNQGDFLWVGFAQGRATLAQSQYGLGLVYGIGGGSTKIIACPEATANVARAQFAAGAVVYQGTGFVFLLNVTRFSTQVANAFFGAGNNVYLGAGGLVSILTAMRSARVAQPKITIRQGMTVGTNKIPGTAVAYKSNLFASNGGTRIISTFGRRKRRSRSLETSEEGPQVKVYNSIEEMPEDLTLEQELEAATGPRQPWGPLGDPKVHNSLLAIDNVFTDKIIRRIPPQEDFVAHEAGSRSRNPYLKRSIIRGDRKYDVHDMIFNFPRRMQTAGRELDNIEGTTGLWVGTNDTSACLVVNSESNGQPTPINHGNCQTLNYESAIPKNRPMDRLREALGRASPKFDESRIMPFGMRAMSSEGDLPATFMHRGDLTLFCRHSDLKKDSSHVNTGCNGDMDVRDALRTYLKMPELPMAISCDVVPMRIVDLLKRDLGFDWDQHNTPDVYSEDPTCNGWTKCTVSTSVQDPDIAKAVGEGLKNVSSTAEGKAAVVTLLQEAQVTAAGTGHTPELTTCDLHLKLMGEGRPLRLPAVGQPEYKPVRGQGASIGPKIDVVAPGDQVASDKVRLGEDTTVYLTNFPDQCTINVKCITRGDATGPMVLTVANVTDGAINSATWTVGEDCCTPGRKYLYGYCTSAPAIFAFSLPFRCRKK